MYAVEMYKLCFGCCNTECFDRFHCTIGTYELVTVARYQIYSYTNSVTPLAQWEVV